MNMKFHIWGLDSLTQQKVKTILISNQMLKYSLVGWFVSVCQESRTHQGRLWSNTQLLNYSITQLLNYSITFWSNTHRQDELCGFAGKVESIKTGFYPGGTLWHPDQGLLHHLQPVETGFDSRRALQWIPDVPQAPLSWVLVTSWFGQKKGRGSHLTLSSIWFLFPASCSPLCFLWVIDLFCTLLSTLSCQMLLFCCCCSI